MSTVKPLDLTAGTLVVRWNTAALDAIRRTQPSPPVAARALAILNTCIYDAWAAYDAVAVGTRLGGYLRLPPAERTRSNRVVAISIAAYRALADLFPASDFKTPGLPAYEQLLYALNLSANDHTQDPLRPAGVGNRVAQAVLAYRHGDGANQRGDLSPGRYRDPTGYRPVNTPDTIDDPNRWQPLRLSGIGGAAVVQSFAAPHWGLVTPFALTAADQFRPPSGPAQEGTLDYLRQAEAILAYSAHLTDEQKVIAEYWADGPDSELPPGHWILIAQFVSERDHHSLDKDVKLFFALSNALLDASIVCWETKRAFDSVRPITAIHHLFADQTITAWRGPYQGSGPLPGHHWRPYQPPTFVTPPFPEYVSGHSTFSAAAAEILKRFTGSDHFGGRHTQLAGTSRIEPRPGPHEPPAAYIVPATDLTLYWATFTDAADQAGLSRRYGGLHFVQGDLDARPIGRAVATQVWQKAQRYFEGLVCHTPTDPLLISSSRSPDPDEATDQ